jgi:hypothetical protein
MDLKDIMPMGTPNEISAIDPNWYDLISK